MGTKTAQRTSLADALFSATQQRVLGVLFATPDRSFFANELFRRAGAGRGSVQRELERLVSSGLVTAERVGNQKHYRANAASPLFHELRSIIAKTSGIADPLRAALQHRPMASKIALAFIYGSVARGEAHAGSDVDLLVVASDVTLEQLYKRIEDAEKVVARKVSVTLYTPTEFRDRLASNAFVQKVLAGPVIPLIGNVDDAKTAR